MVGSEQRPIHPMRVIGTVREVFGRDATAAIDVGVLAQGMGGAFPYFKVYAPRSCIVPSSFYGMGFASSALPVAKLVHPDRPAVGFVGDGSFQMIMNVLPTAVEHKLPVTWCVLNDGALGSIWTASVPPSATGSSRPRSRRSRISRPSRRPASAMASGSTIPRRCGRRSSARATPTPAESRR